MKRAAGGLKALITVEAIAKLMRFGVVGVTCTLIYLVIGYTGTLAGLGVGLAHTIAVIISLFASYIGQKVFTFRRNSEHARYGSRFLIATGGIVLAQYALVFALREAGLAPLLIFLASSAFYPVASLAVHWSWTFRTSLSD